MVKLTEGLKGGRPHGEDRMDTGLEEERQRASMGDNWQAGSEKRQAPAC